MLQLRDIFLKLSLKSRDRVALVRPVSSCRMSLVYWGGQKPAVNYKSILVVEDNPGDERLIKRALQKSNIANEIIVLQDGAEAVDFLFGEKSSSDMRRVPSFVLLDLSLPNVAGLEILEQIRSKEPTQLLPVVILTSSREQSDIVNSYKLGANSYITKPIDSDEFVEKVQQVASYWLSLNEIVT
jgi:two-component system, response regulator